LGDFRKEVSAGAGHLDEGRFQLTHRAIDDPLLIPIQIAAGLRADHGELIDEHFGQREIDLRLAALRVRDLPEEQGGVLRLHHDELDENLRHFARFGLGLDFSHRRKSMPGKSRLEMKFLSSDPQDGFHGSQIHQGLLDGRTTTVTEGW
jgi:hypothetical protein